MSKYTAKEYQKLLLAVFDFAITEEKRNFKQTIENPHDPNKLFYLEGYINGLKEAKRKVECSNFLLEDIPDLIQTK